MNSDEHARVGEPDPSCFWGFVEQEDPALSTFANRPGHTNAERHAFFMGMAAGRLEAAYELRGYHNEGGVNDLTYVLDKYLFVQRALRRQRDARAFVRILDRHMPDGGHADGQA